MSRVRRFHTTDDKHVQGQVNPASRPTDRSVARTDETTKDDRVGHWVRRWTAETGNLEVDGNESYLDMSTAVYSTRPIRHRGLGRWGDVWIL